MRRYITRYEGYITRYEENPSSARIIFLSFPSILLVSEILTQTAILPKELDKTLLSLLDVKLLSSSQVKNQIGTPDRCLMVIYRYRGSVHGREIMSEKYLVAVGMVS